MQPVDRRTLVRCIGAVAVIVAAAGCENGKRHEAYPEAKVRPAVVDPMLLTAPRDLAVRNAVIRQHTLEPYHFLESATALNELGRRDLDILIEHYRRYPGPLHVRQGHAPDALYQARVAAVREALRAGGVDAGQIEIADRPPGGDGVTGERAALIQQQSQSGSPQRPASVGSVTIQGGQPQGQPQ